MMGHQERKENEMNHDFQEPVFVRVDETTDVKASVVVWDEGMGGVSVLIKGSSDSVLINAEDWPKIVSCINAALERNS